MHTDYDGDTVFCLASGHKPVLNPLLLQTAAAYAAERAVIAAVSDCADCEIVFDESATDEREGPEDAPDGEKQ